VSGNDGPPDEIPAHVNAVSGDVIDAAMTVHRELGPGLLESVYKKCLQHELRLRGRIVDREVAVPVVYRGLVIEPGLRMDMLVDGVVIVEAKARQGLHPVTRAQLLSYMRLANVRVGLIFNFHTLRLRDEWERLVL
jgi:GxxExxY protein